MNDAALSATGAIDAVQVQDAPVNPASSDQEHSPLDLFRADAYALLGSLLAQAPTDELLNWLQSIELIDDPQSSMREAWSVLQMAAGRADPDQVADEYHQLFIGIGRGELLPYGSWYLTGFLMEKPLVELRNDLDALGIERDPDVREPEDHIAALCQVMAMLVNPEQNGGDQGPAQQFFERHLATWWRRFSQDLQHSKTAHFYSAVGRFAELFLEQEALLFSRR